MNWNIIILCCLFYAAFSETINRDVASDHATIACTDWPCIINCNAAYSCSYAIISCPSTGSGDCTINLNSYNSLQYGTINAGNNVNNFAVSATDANYAMYYAEINVESLSGALSVSVNGNSYYAFHYATLTVTGDIAGNVEIIEDTSGAIRNYVNRNFWLGKIQINGDIGGSFLAESRFDNGQEAFDYSTFAIAAVAGDVTFKSNTFGSFSESHITVSGDVGGNVLFEDKASGGYGFYNSFFNFHGVIAGDASFIEESAVGLSFYSTEFDIVSVGGSLLFQSVTDNKNQAFDLSTFDIGTVTVDLSFLSNTFGSFSECHINVANDIGGNVLCEDTSTGGHGFYQSFFNFHGVIAGDARFIEESAVGLSFYSTEFDIVSVGGSLLFQSVTDNKNQAFDLSTFDIGTVTVDLSFLSNTFGSFSECHINVANDIGGNVLFEDTASGGLGFYDSFFNFHGDIGGDCSFIEDNNYGASFAYSEFDVNSVQGNLLFSALIDNGLQAFDQSIFSIGAVAGELNVLSNTYGAFSECLFNINSVGETASFVGTASGGYDFYSTDINIENCPKVYISAENTHSTTDSHNYFGADVGLVEVVMNGGVNALYSSLFDAQNAAEFTLTCNSNADCSDVEIKCPENNQDDKCRVNCETLALCTNIDLFTTNGYCVDASFHCLDANNMCGIDYTSQVFCTVGSSYVYGVRGSDSECQMTKHANGGGFYCNDIGSAQCSTESFCVATEEPTTAAPTTAAPTTAAPTTAAPTTAAPTTTAPPTFQPCTVVNEAYNIQFIIDESGSVQRANYANSIDFVINLVRDDINAISKVSALSFSTDNDDIYAFTQTQTDGRAAIIDALLQEKRDYAKLWTDTYSALVRGIEMFTEASIPASGNNLLFLVTDGTPNCGEDSSCIADVCAQQTLLDALDAAGIYVRIVLVGNVDTANLQCLVDDDASRMYTINDFSSTEFKSIERQFRSILCPAAPVPQANSVGFGDFAFYNDYPKNGDGVNDNDGVEFLLLNIMIVVVVAVCVMSLCYAAYRWWHFSKGAHDLNVKYEEVVNLNEESL